MYKKYVLEHVKQDAITTYLNYSTLLCAILAKKNNHEWVYNHFTNIYSMDCDNYLWIDYLEENEFFADVIQKEHFTLEQFCQNESAIGIIKKNIQNGKYISFFSDSFFLIGKPCHELVELFVYGYDDDRQEIYTIGFDKSRNFGDVIYGYNEIEAAFKFLKQNHQKFSDEIPIWVKWWALCSVDVKSDRKIKFSREVFLRDLENYLTGVEQDNLLRPEIITQRGSSAFYGIKAQQHIIQCLKSLSDGNDIMDYRAIHLLNEHKKLILEKVNLIASETENDSNFRNIINEYAELCRKMNKIRMIYLKSAMLESSYDDIYCHITNKKMILKMAEMLSEVNADEKNVLSKIVEYSRR